MTVSLLLYTRKFLNLKQHEPLFDKILKWLVVIRIVIYLLAVAFDPVVDPWFGKHAVLHNPIIDAVFLLPALLLGYIRFFKGDRFALYFELAFTLLYLGFIVHAFGFNIKLSLFRQLDSGFIQSFFFEIILLEVFAFSLAIAEKMRLVKADREKAMQEVIVQLEENASLREAVNRDLEQKVRERTRQLEEQSDEIRRMNELLTQHNLSLEENVKSLSKARVTLKPVSFEEFKTMYPDEDACTRYLVDLKWGKGFVCRKCSNRHFVEGKNQFARRCNRCWYEETPTVGTIFHKLKFPVEKAFYLLFLVTNNNKISIDELSQTLQLSERTCWSYKNKIMEVVETNKKAKKPEGGWDSIILSAKV